MATTIDGAWLASAANGGPDGPWLLNTADETFKLGVDVTAQETAFVVAQSGITLDLNGKTVTYNDAPFNDFTNQDFTADAVGATSLSGWTTAGATLVVADMTASGTSPLRFPDGYFTDASGDVLTRCVRVTVPAAKSATIATGNPAPVACTGHGLTTGDWAFLNGFSTSAQVGGTLQQVTVTDADNFTVPVNVTSVTTAAGRVGKASVLKSSGVAVPRANRRYAAGFTSADRQTLSSSHDAAVRVWDTGAGAYLAEMAAGTDQALSYQSLVISNTRGFAATSVVVPTGTAPVQVHLFLGNDATSAAQDVDLMRARFSRAYDLGVCFAGQFEGQFPSYANWPSGVQSAYVANRTRKGFTLLDSSLSPAAATAVVVSGVLSSFTVTAPGSGYRTAPAVVLVGGGAGVVPGQATASVSGGVVTGISVDRPGSGYRSAPTVVLAGGAGGLSQGRNRGFKGHGLWCEARDGDLLARDADVAVNGDDTIPLGFGSRTGGDDGRLTVGGAAGHGVRAVYQGRPNITRRFNVYAGVTVGGSYKDPVEVSYSALVDGPHQGVSVSAADASPRTATVRFNGVFPRAAVANGYSIATTYNGGVVGDNLVDAYNAGGRGGRGIYLAAASNRTVRNVAVDNNVVDLYERGDRENFDLSSPVRAFRLRNQEDSAVVNAVVADVAVTNNTFTGRTAPGLQATAMGGRVSLVRDNGNYADNVTFSGNVFRGVAEGSGLAAVGLELDANFPDNSGVTFAGDVFESNHISLRLTGTDTAITGLQVDDVTFTGCTFSKSPLGVPYAHQSLAAGPGGGASKIGDGVLFVSPSASGGAVQPAASSGNVHWAGTGTKTLRFAWREAATCRDDAGTLLPGVTLTAANASGALDDTRTSDQAGAATLLCVVKRYDQPGTNPAALTTTSYVPHAFLAARGGYAPASGSASLSADGAAEFVLGRLRRRFPSGGRRGYAGRSPAGTRAHAGARGLVG